MEDKKLDLEQLKEIKEGYLAFARKHKHLLKNMEFSYMLYWTIHRDVYSVDIDSWYYTVRIENKEFIFYEFEIERDTLDYLLENDLLEFIDVYLYDVDIMRYELKLDFQDLGL